MSELANSNPYAVTTDQITDYSLGGDAVLIRKQFISHEASVRSIGLLYWLGGILAILCSLAYVGLGIGFLSDARTMPTAIFMLMFSPVMAALGIFQIFVARGLRRLTPWARIGASVVSVIGLLGFPFGTIISAYFLYLLLSRKGEYVFSPEYKAIIDATPGIKYRTSPIIWVLLGLLVLLLGSIIVAGVAGR
ncbi:MAG: hypothetical protein ACTHOU_07965 [Aureliella sp.]